MAYKPNLSYPSLTPISPLPWTTAFWGFIGCSLGFHFLLATNFSLFEGYFLTSIVDNSDFYLQLVKERSDFFKVFFKLLLLLKR